MFEALEADDRLLRAQDVLDKIERHLVGHTSVNADRVRAVLLAPERVVKAQRLRTRAKEAVATLEDFQDVRFICLVWFGGVGGWVGGWAGR